jgi:hypothetical protein
VRQPAVPRLNIGTDQKQAADESHFARSQKPSRLGEGTRTLLFHNFRSDRFYSTETLATVDKPALGLPANTSQASQSSIAALTY